MRLTDLAARYCAANTGFTVYEIGKDSAILQHGKRYVRLNSDGSTTPVRVEYQPDSRPGPLPTVKDGENPYATRFYEAMQRLFDDNPSLTWEACRERLRLADPDAYLAAFGQGKDKHDAIIFHAMQDGAQYPDALSLANRLCEDVRVMRLAGGR